MNKLRILSVRIVNIGPFKDSTISFTDDKGDPLDIVLLAGPNGSGKTTLLETVIKILNILNYALPPTNLKLNKDAYAQVDIHFYNNLFSIFYGKNLNDRKLQQKTYGYEIIPQNKTASIGNSFNEIQEIIQGTMNLQQEKLDFTNTKELLPSILYLPHYRVIKPVKGDTINKELLTYQWISTYTPSNDQFRGSLDSYLVWLDYARPESFNEIKDFLNKYALEGKQIDRIEKEQLKTIIKTNSGGEHYLEQLSSGEQNIITLLLEIKRRLIPGSVIMIDEIENSLHEAFQYKIGNILKKLQQEYSLQLIITSHSETFMKIFGEENTVILS